MMIADESIPIVIASLAFVVICLLFLGITIFFRRRQYQRELLTKIGSEEDDWTMFDADPAPIDISQGSTNLFTRFLGTVGAKVKPGLSADENEINLKFLRAGMRGRHVPFQFWGTKALLAVSLPTAFFVIVALFLTAMNTNHMFIWGGVFALAGLLLPDFWLRSKTNKRKEKLKRAFPDALDLLVVCVEAGMGLDAAIKRVGEEIKLSHRVLSDELNWLNLELRAGKNRQTALRNLASRTDIDDVHSLVTLLIQTDRFGTSVARTLKVYANSFRTARFQKAEELAATLGTKLIFPLALCFFPSFFVAILGPIVVQVFRVFLQD
ncbi:MAG: type II secretion system F family protein [Desulfobacteraceae bacterium]|jgi:tight adherence protein C